MQNHITKLPSFTFTEIENIITGNIEQDMYGNRVRVKSPSVRRMANTYKKVKDIMME
jgi:hypothetical protein